MKIAFVAQPIDFVLPPRQNSVGIVTYQVARRLAKSCSVVVYLKGGRLRKKTNRSDAIEYHHIPVGPDKWLLRFLEGFSRFLSPKRPLFASSFYYLWYILRVALDLRKQQCDIVHVHNLSQFVTIIRALNPKTKIILHMHCEWLIQLDLRMIERRIKATDIIISCSEYVTKKSRLRFAQFSERFHTIHNGVDTNHFSRDNIEIATDKDNNERILFVGRISPEKGVHVLLDSFQEVLRRYPNAALQVVGPMRSAPLEYLVTLSDDEKVLELASYYARGYDSHVKKQMSSGLENHVTFTSSVPYLQLTEQYVRAHFFVFPSVWQEPFGMPIIEAMACCLPVVATRSGGIPEIIEDGKTGFLVERNDAAALAKAMLRLCEDRELQESMGLAGRQRVLEQFTWDRITEITLAKYRNTCGTVAASSVQN